MPGKKAKNSDVGENKKRALSLNSIRVKILVFFLALSLLPLGVVFVISLTQMRGSLEDVSKENLETLSAEVSVEVERFLDQRVGDVSLLALNPGIQDAQIDRDVKRSALSDMMDTHLYYEDVTIITPEGTTLVAVNYLCSGYWSSNAWFQRAMDGEVVVSEVHKNQQGDVVLLVMAPILSGGTEPSGIVCAMISAEQLWDIVDRVQVGDTGYAFMVNKLGTIITHPDKALILEKVEGAFPESPMEGGAGSSSIELDGTDYIISYHGVGSTILYGGSGAWGLYIVQEESEVLEVSGSLQLNLIIIMLIATVVIVVASIILSRDVSRPLVQLVGATKKVAGGDLCHKVTVKGPREIKELEGAFNAMTLELKAHQDRLKANIKELDETNKKIDSMLKERERTIKEIKKFIKVYDAVSKGSFDQPIPHIKTDDELGHLSKVTERMVNSVRMSMKAMEEMLAPK